MKKTPLPILAILLLILALSGFQACQEQTQKKTKHQDQKKTNLINLEANKTRFNKGEPITFLLTPKKEKTNPAEIQIFLNKKPVSKARLNDTIHLSTDTLALGQQNIKISISYDEEPDEKKHLQVLVLPKSPPQKLKYKIIADYPHDKKAYTQGLVYLNGFLYESTGRWGQSSLRKVNYQKNKILQKIELDDKYFAEGITIIDDYIIQLTYKAQKAFFYDLETFEKTGETYYPNIEGWGLTFDGKYLIMSDGSDKLFFYEKDNFKEIRQLTIYDNKGPVNLLNELEYIKGMVYANIYGKDYILRIDPETGAVTGKVDFSGLLSPSDHHRELDVLNGIAWNPDNQHFFITGKNWPRLFELIITENSNVSTSF